MDEIKTVYASLDEIPQNNIRDFYEQTDKGFVLKTAKFEPFKGLQSEVNKTSHALTQEREFMKSLKGTLKERNISIDDLPTLLNEYSEYKSNSQQRQQQQGGNDEFKNRLNEEVTPLKRTLEAKDKDIERLTKQLQDLQSKQQRAELQEFVRAVCLEKGVIPSAIDDVFLHAQNGFKSYRDEESGSFRVTDNQGTPFSMWLEDQVSKRGHWFPQSQGIGANGGGGASRTSGKIEISRSKAKNDPQYYQAMKKESDTKKIPWGWID